MNSSSCVTAFGRQADLVNTTESILSVCDKPYLTNKRKVKTGKEVAFCSGTAHWGSPTQSGESVYVWAVLGACSGHGGNNGQLYNTSARWNHMYVISRINVGGKVLPFLVLTLS